MIALKYLFFDNSIHSAVKFGFGYMKGTRQGLVTDYVYDFYPAIIFSGNIKGSWQIYLAPRCIYSIHTRDRQEHSNRRAVHIFQYGLGIGLAIGKQFLLLPESNWLIGNNSGTKYIVNQFGLGVELKIK